MTGKGHGALIRERFGRGWGLLSAGTLFATAVGAKVLPDEHRMRGT